MRSGIVCFLLCFVFCAGADTGKEEESEAQNIPLDLNLWNLDFLESVEEASSEEGRDFSPSKKLPCVWFLKTGFENEDDFLGVEISNGGVNDAGYTHGHITALLRSCPSGDDLSLRLDSRLYILTHGFDLSRLEDGETFEFYPRLKMDPTLVESMKGTKLFHAFLQETPVTAVKTDDVFLETAGWPKESEKFTRIWNFEEETRITLEHSNWRDFDRDFYNRLGVFIGRLSVNDNFILAGFEQEFFHDLLDGVEGIYKYKYRRDGDTRNFAGVLIGFGKSLPLSATVQREGPKGRICAIPCFAYITGEGGFELVSEEDLSFVYIASEANMAFGLSDAGEAAGGLSVGIQAKQYPMEGDKLLEAFLGLNLHIFEGVFLQSRIHKRKVLSEGYYLRYDWDDEPFFYFGLDFRL